MALEELCRLCGCESTSEGIPIFDSFGKAGQLYEKLKICIPVQIYADDSLPKKICFQCLTNLVNCHTFIQCCLSTDVRLRQMHANRQENEVMNISFTSVCPIKTESELDEEVTLNLTDCSPEPSLLNMTENFEEDCVIKPEEIIISDSQNMFFRSAGIIEDSSGADDFRNEHSKDVNSKGSQMSRPHVGKSKCRQVQWSKDEMEQAVKSVLSGMTLRAASIQHKIPRRTLRYHVQAALLNTKVKKVGGPALFTNDQEHIFVKCLLHLKAIGKVVTEKDARHEAYKFAELHNIRNNFNRNTKSAGRAWFKGFLNRNSSTLSFQRHKLSTSTASV